MFTALLPLAMLPGFSALDDQSAIRLRIDQYYEATRTFNVPALDKILDTNYAEVSPLGDYDPRAKVLEYLADPKYKAGPTPDFSLDEFHWNLIQPGVMQVVYKNSIKFNGMTLPMRINAVWRKEGDTWMLSSQSATSIRSRPKPAK